MLRGAVRPLSPFLKDKMLERVTHIEGLDAHEDHELSNDTNPGGVFVKFFVKSEEQPFLTAKENRIVRKNILCVRITQELGRTEQVHPVRDKVVFDEATGKWKILQLLPGKQSYIRRFPEAWNAFHRGSADVVTGTPLEVLFKNDPSKVEAYKFRHITVIEQLAALNNTDAENLGMGGRDDVERAKRFIEKAKQGASSVELVASMEDMRRENASLKAQVGDLMEKLKEVLSTQIEAVQESPAKMKKVSKKIEKQEPVDGIEGIGE